MERVASVLQAQAQNAQSYFVQFKYDDDKYAMRGGNTVPLSEILDTLHLAGKVTKVEFDTPGLTAQREGGTWMVTSDQKFDNTKSMYVTIDGNRQQVYVNTETFYIKAVPNQEIWHNGGVNILYLGGSQSFTVMSSISNLPLQWVILAN